MKNKHRKEITRAELCAWYKENVGYSPDEEPIIEGKEKECFVTDQVLREMIVGFMLLDKLNLMQQNTSLIFGLNVCGDYSDSCTEPIDFPQEIHDFIYEICLHVEREKLVTDFDPELFFQKHTDTETINELIEILTA